VLNDQFVELILSKIETSTDHDIFASYTELASTILQSCDIDLKIKFAHNGGLLRLLAVLNKFRT
jgi:hypothetical protein